MDKIKSVNRYTIYDNEPTNLEVKENAGYISRFAEEIFSEAERIDFGQSADVFRDPLNRCCYKLISRRTETLLSAEEEAGFLSELQDADSEVKVPLPLFSMEATVVEDTGKITRKSIICMERIEGPSIKDILTGKAELPENFNADRFFSALKSFIYKMNSKYNIYHRDLHEGNIMIDEVTLMPRVIDFGLSRRKTLTDENPYENEVDIKNRVFTFKKDTDEVVRVEKELREYISYTKTKNVPTMPAFNKADFSFKDTRSVSINQIHSFDIAVQETVSLMNTKQINESQISGSLGLWLVKDETEQFEKRKETALILYPKQVNGVKYFVCRN